MSFLHAYQVRKINHRKWPFFVDFLSIHLGQLDPLHFEVSGPQTQHSNGPNVNALLPPKAKIKAGDAVAAAREAVPSNAYVQWPNVGKQVRASYL